jgi:peroxiredoxin
VVAIAADPVSDMATLQATLPKLTLLSDLDQSAATAWGLHVAGAEAPSPGTFVIGRDGLVQWRRLADNHGDWPTYPELAAALP